MKELTNLRYPKNLVSTELATQKSTQSMTVIDENRKLTTDKLKSNAYQLAGAYPYLFDCITMLCNENPTINGEPIVQQVPDSFFLHATLTWEDFKHFALGSYRKETKNTLLKELLKLQDSKTVKAISIGNGIIVRTSPIQITLYQEATDKNDSRIKNLIERQRNLRNKKTEEIMNQMIEIKKTNADEAMAEELMDKLEDIIESGKDDSEKFGKIYGIEITFFGPLFEAALKEIGGPFVQIGTNFQAKLETSIRQFKNSPKFMKYRSVRKYPPTYRKYALYLAERDNGNGDYITIKAEDMLIHVDPQNLNTHLKIRNTNEMRIFVDKANMLLNEMARNGLLKGFRYAPKKCTYNASSKEFIIGVYRESDKTMIPEYEGNLTDEELAAIAKDDESVGKNHNAF